MIENGNNMIRYLFHKERDKMPKAAKPSDH